MSWQDDPRYQRSLECPIHCVEPGLYIGSMHARTVAQDHGVTHVVSLVTQQEAAMLPPLPSTIHERRHRIDDANTPAIYAYLDALLDATTSYIRDVRALGGVVLVHCVMGISRSSTVVLDYLMARDAFPLDAALERLTAVRYCVCPNPAFQRVLEDRALRYPREQEVGSDDNA